MTENDVEQNLTEKLQELKYTYRSDIRDRVNLEKNFREKFEALNRVRLEDSEFACLLEKIINPDVYASAKLLRELNTFECSHPASLHTGEQQGLVQKYLRGRQSTALNTQNNHQRYEYNPAHQRCACSATRIKDTRYQSAQSNIWLVDPALVV